jgi:hypothetical protein
MKPVLLKATGMPTLLLLGIPRRRVTHLRGSVEFGVHKATPSPSSLVFLSHFIHAVNNLIQFASRCVAGYWSTGVLEYWGTGLWSGGGVVVTECSGDGVSIG